MLRQDWAAAWTIFLGLLRHEALAAECLHQLALIAHHQSDPGRAKLFFMAAITAAPNQGHFYGNFAILLNGVIGDDAAAHLCLRALRLDSQDANYANLQGVLSGRRGDRIMALHWLKRSVALAPEIDGAYNNLGMDAMTYGDAAGAARNFRRSILLNPLAHGHFTNSANLRLRANQPVHAEIWCRAALVRAPGDGLTLNSLGVALQERGHIVPAALWMERAVRVAPSYSYAAMNLIFARLYHPATRLAENRAYAEHWARRQFGELASLSPRQQLPARPMRLGFVSADFREHAVGHLCLPAIESLARMGYEVFLYSAKAREDGFTRKFQEVAAAWRPIAGMDDRSAAQLIEQDRIDILFDLGGYSADNRLAVFAYRPAPVQISWLGYPGTTGLSALDYILADNWQIPEGSEEGYSEKVIRLPHSYVAYRAQASVPEVSELPARKNGFITFGSFNALKKISPALLRHWAIILQRTPNSRLLLKSPPLGDPDTGREVLFHFDAAGIERSRLTLLGVTSPAEHQRIMGEVDIALDSAPYAGGLTTLDTLWMGVPVVACAGETFCSRHSLGYLSTLGLRRLVARDMEEYVSIAVALAADYDELAQLRNGLRPLMSTSPLCDADGFAKDLATALNIVWERRVSGQRVDHVRVERRRG